MLVLGVGVVHCVKSLLAVQLPAHASWEGTDHAPVLGSASLWEIWKERLDSPGVALAVGGVWGASRWVESLSLLSS